MASNAAFHDGFGESSDWIELHNASNSAVDLTGWSLSDDPQQLRKWTFDDAAIAAGQRMLVWASGLDRTDPQGQPHTNFKLKASGEFIALVDPRGEIVSSFGSHDTEYPAQRSDVSYGIGSNGTTGYFRNPTPGQANGVSFQGFVADTKFSVNRGFFVAPLFVGIHSDTAHATLVYTLDGSLPTPTHGTKVEGGPDGVRTTLRVDTTTTLRAMAFRDGWEPTNVDTQTYVFLDHVIRQTGAGLPDNWGHAGADYQMDARVVDDPRYRDEIVDGLKSIPSLSLVTDIEHWFGRREGIYLQGKGDPRPVSMELLFADGERGIQVDGSVEIQGGSSTNRWKSDKLSMQLKFQREFGDASFDYPLFGDAAAVEFDTLILDARLNQAWHYGGGSAPTAQRERAQYTRDQFVADLQNRLGGRAPNGQWVHVYLNGIYWGIYNLHERPDEHFAAAYLGGTESDYDIIKHNSRVVHGSYHNYRELLRLVNRDTRTEEIYASVAEILDVDQLIDYILINYYVGNMDWAHHNWYASFNKVEAGGKWRFHSWDAEHVLKELADDATDRDDEFGPTHLHRRLLRNDQYQLRFQDAVQRLFFHDGLLTPEPAKELYRQRLDQVAQAVVPESARWGDNQRRRPYTRDVEWMRERDRLLEDYFPQRTTVVVQQLRNRGFFHRYDAPRFHIHGGSVDVGQAVRVRSGGDVYYTLDGSDPKDSDTRLLYADDGIAIQESVVVRVRALRGSEWSALVEASFRALPPGDFSGDGLVHSRDLDMLFTAVRDGTGGARFDLNADGFVTDSDADYWIAEIANTRRGDFDLDGAVTFDDFSRLLSNFGKHDARSTEGDASGDGLVDFEDFVILATEFGFRREQ